LVLGYTAIFTYFIFKLPFFRVEGLNQKTITGIFLLKVAAGIVMWALYNYHYTDRATADIFKFFDDSKVMYNALWERPTDYFKMLFGYQNDNEYFNKNYYVVMMNWYREYESSVNNDAHTIIRFNAVIRLFSFGHYNVHTVFMCFFSLIGLTALYKAFYRLMKSKLLIIAVFLVPSLLFWGSGVLKEGLLFFGLGIIVMNYFRVLDGKLKWPDAILTLSCLVLVFYLKFYVLAAMLVSLIAYAFTRKESGGKVILKFIIVSILVFAFALNLHHIVPGYNILELLAQKQKDFIGLAAFLNAGSTLVVHPLEPNIWSFIRNAPEALYHTLCQPWLFTSTKPFMMIAGMENLIILMFIVFAFIFRKRWGDMNQPLVWFCLFFLLQLFLIIGWTTVISGAIVRYKIPGIPFLLFTLILMMDMEKLRRRFPNNSIPKDQEV